MGAECEMRLLLSTHDARGGVQPLMAGTIRADGATVAATLPLDRS
jgi:hypothetical protein